LGKRGSPETAEERKQRQEYERNKKAKQRQGYTTLNVSVHLPSLVCLLLAEGLITDKDIEDRDAIEAATSEHLRVHQHTGRILQDRGKPVSRLRGGLNEISDWVRDQEHQGWREEFEADRKKLAQRLEEQGPGPEFYMTGAEHATEQRQALEDALKVPPPPDWPFRVDRLQQHGRHLYSETPPDWSEPRRSGRNGRNTGVIPGPSYRSKPLPRKSDKKIKPPSAAELGKLEQPFGKLTPPDTSVHTVASADGEADLRLDRLEAEDEGIHRSNATVHHSKLDDGSDKKGKKFKKLEPKRSFLDLDSSDFE
jgi:hypothetical protein